MGAFTHLDQEGNPSMVDVGEKVVTKRTAIARALVYLPDEVVKALEGDQLNTKKGSIIQSSVIAGIMAAKKTSELIPLCHPLPMDNCKIEIKFEDQNNLEILASATVHAKTGVEMEALTAASVAALNVYDMCKALSHDIVIKEIKLLKKTGGKSDYESR